MSESISEMRLPKIVIAGVKNSCASSYQITIHSSLKTTTTKICIRPLKKYQCNAAKKNKRCHFVFYELECHKIKLKIFPVLLFARLHLETQKFFQASAGLSPCSPANYARALK